MKNYVIGIIGGIIGAIVVVLIIMISPTLQNDFVGITQESCRDVVFDYAEFQLTSLDRHFAEGKAEKLLRDITDRMVNAGCTFEDEQEYLAEYRNILLKKSTP